MEEAVFVEGYEAKENQWDIQKLYGMGFIVGWRTWETEKPCKAHSGRIG